MLCDSISKLRELVKFYLQMENGLNEGINIINMV